MQMRRSCHAYSSQLSCMNHVPSVSYCAVNAAADMRGRLRGQAAGHRAKARQKAKKTVTNCHYSPHIAILSFMKHGGPHFWHAFGIFIVGAR